MKKLYIVFAVLTGLFAACEKSGQNNPGGEKRAILFDVGIAGYPGVARAGAELSFMPEDYFGVEGQNRVAIRAVVSGTVGNYDYTYSEGKLVPISEANTIYYAVDESPIDLTFSWPYSRPATLPTDQSEQNIFLASDWLKVTMKGVPHPTSPEVTFQHELSRVVFRLTGAMAGTKIVRLTIAGYEAFCAPDEDGICDAYLILDPSAANPLAAGAMGDIYLDGESYERTFRLTDIPALAAGEEHVILINM